MVIMASMPSRTMKRYSIEPNFTLPIARNLKRLRGYSTTTSKHDWTLDCRRKSKKHQQQYHCYVYLKLFPSTLKCSIDVLVKSVDASIDNYADCEAILIGQTRLPKSIQPGVVRVRLVSSIFAADVDVHEDLSLSKLETIPSQAFANQFDKQFALIFKNNRIGPGVIGKLFVESLDPSNGSYTNNPPIFELNLNLACEHEILVTSSAQKRARNSPLPCGCLLSPEHSHSVITDRCNLTLGDIKVVHRLADPLRCHWKSIGRELSPCFSENDLIDLNQRYFLTEGNHECAYQLLREWYIRDPHRANIRYLLTELKLPFDLIETIHNDVVRRFLTS